MSTEAKQTPNRLDFMPTRWSVGMCMEAIMEEVRTAMTEQCPHSWSRVVWGRRDTRGNPMPFIYSKTKRSRRDSAAVKVTFTKTAAIVKWSAGHPQSSALRRRFSTKGMPVADVARAITAWTVNAFNADANNGLVS